MTRSRICRSTVWRHLASCQKARQARSSPTGTPSQAARCRLTLTEAGCRTRTPACTACSPSRSQSARSGAMPPPRWTALRSALCSGTAACSPLPASSSSAGNHAEVAGRSPDRFRPEFVYLSMAIVEVDISMSVDGFVTGPELDKWPGLGKGGELLHAWLGHDEGRRLSEATFAASGAVVTSRLVYELTGGCGEDGFYRMPVFVVT